MNDYKVYKHTNLQNGKVYIGITCKDVAVRWKNGKGYQKGTHFRNAIDKYGWGNFAHDILFENLNEDEAKRKEIELIALYKSADREYGYNTTNGGDGTSGLKHSEETRKKLSEMQIGLHRSPRTEFKKGMTPWNKGKKASDEYRRKISEAHKGKPSLKRKKVICVETGVVYDSVTSAAEAVGSSSTTISAVCKGDLKTSKGYRWEYYVEGGDANG